MAYSTVSNKLNQISVKKVSFYYSWPHPFVYFIIIYMQATTPPIYCWNPVVFVASFPFWIERYNIFPNLEHTELLNSVSGGSVFLNTN